MHAAWPSPSASRSESSTLDEPYALSATTREEYQRNGHVLLHGLASSAELDAFAPAIACAVERYNPERRLLAERDTYGRAFLQTTNLWHRDPTVRRFSLARRFARVAAELMGVSGVRLYHDQALFKEPGGGLTPWHQDQYYWPLDTDDTITMWMPLSDVVADMGIMRFASGSHHCGCLESVAISDESEMALSEFVRDRGFPVVGADAMHAGDATFHAGWTLHSAPPNLSSKLRAVMTVIYFADGARVIDPDNPQRKDDLRGWLPGCKPGDLACSPLNPLLWSDDPA